MKYKVCKTNVINPGIDSEEWKKANVGELTFQKWKEYYQDIKTTFQILRGPEGISVKMHTDEKNLLAKCEKQNGAVCMDSCMEFFFKPSPWDLRYFNFEINPEKVMHLGLGSGRHNRELIEENRETFSVESIPNDGDWTLKFYIPDKFVLKYFDKISPVCKANFYKCGENTDHSHFITWSEVDVPNPDFHLSDFFGIIEF